MFETTKLPKAMWSKSPEHTERGVKNREFDYTRLDHSLADLRVVRVDNLPFYFNHTRRSEEIDDF